MAMRELLYVSDSKLGTFIEERSRRLPQQVGGEAEVSLFGALKLRFTGTQAVSDAQNAPEKLRKVEKITDHLVSSDHPPLWWQDDSAQIGRWVQFDDPMHWLATRHAVVMWSNISEDDPESVLVLHGSAKHVVPEIPRDHVADETQFATSNIRPFLESMIRINDTVDNYPPSNLPINPDGATTLVLSYLTQAWTGWQEFAHLTGFARITMIRTMAVGPKKRMRGALADPRTKVVFATPLYVERQ